jgi:hypothetical protein
VAPKDHISVGVDHLNPSKASGLRKMAAPITCPVPPGVVGFDVFCEHDFSL